MSIRNFLVFFRVFASLIVGRNMRATFIVIIAFLSITATLAHPTTVSNQQQQQPPHQQEAGNDSEKDDETSRKIIGSR